ncbi:hypothetical protein J6590_032286 [Homalodisca vitripennis]|nr:hypothetical protein J6590_032286 [Homalodisca vitripennis]
MTCSNKSGSQKGKGDGSGECSRGAQRRTVVLLIVRRRAPRHGLRHDTTYCNTTEELVTAWRGLCRYLLFSV